MTEVRVLFGHSLQWFVKGSCLGESCQPYSRLGRYTLQSFFSDKPHGPGSWEAELWEKHISHEFNSVL